MKTLLLIFLGFSSSLLPVQKKENLSGAWENVSGNSRTTCIYTTDYFSVAVYNVAEKKFEGTYGGKYKWVGDELTETIEFDTWQPSNVGTERKKKVNRRKDSFYMIDTQGNAKDFVLVDQGQPGKLSGAWLITARYVDGEMKKSTPGVRRTMKIISGTRFQWIAYNVETKEFFGTGGGTYTSIGGKYIENIEFFSRDASRVGMSLGFDFTLLEDGSWRHSGRSSKGDPIDEIWTQREKLGI